jgi:ABC-type Zn uptake system ZnuABC Zn-binding protein ZnuA
MKKINFILSMFLLVAGLCNLNLDNAAVWAAEKPKLQIVTSLPIVKSIVENVGGVQVKVNSIIKGVACDHEYEPSANDSKQVATCDMFVKIGMGSDLWADKLAKGMLPSKARLLDPAQGIKMLKVRGLENPHYWGSPANVKIMAKNICNGLCSARPEQKAYFTQNYRKFVAKIDQTVATLKPQVAQVAKKSFVSYANAFPYFYEFFGFQNLMAVELSCEQEVSPKDLADAAKLMKAKQIKILVGDAAEPNEPDGLVQETGAKKVLLWATTDESGDYLQTLRHNVATLVKALQ